MCWTTRGGTRADNVAHPHLGTPRLGTPSNQPPKNTHSIQLEFSTPFEATIIQSSASLDESKSPDSSVASVFFTASTCVLTSLTPQPATPLNRPPQNSTTKNQALSSTRIPHPF